MKNIPPALLLLDAYKTGHHAQMPDNTEMVMLNMTPRSTNHALPKLNPDVFDGKLVHFGLQALIKTWLIDHWNETFFNVSWEEASRDYSKILNHFLDDDCNIDHLRALHTLGYLPIEIRGLDEGSLVPMRVPTFIVCNTHKDFSWLPGRLETLLSNEYWKAATIATIARNMRMTVEQFAEMCGSPAWFLPYQAHDFSMRGMSGMFDACNSSMGHGLFFLGTDTLASTWMAERLYGADFSAGPVGKTVNATEHSVMTVRGREGEEDTYKFLLNKYPKGILATVSDQYNLWNVLLNILPGLKDQILARDGRLVIRPDSGNPPDIICGTAHGVKDRFDRSELLDAWSACDNDQKFVVYEIGTQTYARVTVTFSGEDFYQEEPLLHVQGLLDSEVTPEMRGAYACLYEVFGGEMNEKGFIDLNPKVGLIYGDSIDPRSFSEIAMRLIDKGFSISNLVVGLGSYCYQFITRDTFAMAIKATYAYVDGAEHHMVKDPITGDGVKKSATGLLKVVEQEGTLVLEEGGSAPMQDILDGNFDSGLLGVVFRNSKLIREETWAGIKARVGA